MTAFERLRSFYNCAWEVLISKLDSLLGETFQTATEFQAVHIVSGDISQPSSGSPILNSLTVQVLNSITPAAIRGYGSGQVTIVGVNDRSNTVSFVYDGNVNVANTAPQPAYILGYDAATNSLLADAYDAGIVAENVSAGIVPSMSALTWVWSASPVVPRTITYQTLNPNGTIRLQPSDNATSAASPVYRFFDTNDGTHFFTSSPTEVRNDQATRPDMTLEGVAFDSVASGASDAAPVFRFFDTLHGTHFFTAQASERDSIFAMRPDLTYEGVGFYEYTSQQANTVPVYRYFDSVDGTHLFTQSTTEMASIAATRPDLKPEGVAFFARPLPLRSKYNKSECRVPFRTPPTRRNAD